MNFIIFGQVVPQAGPWMFETRHLASRPPCCFLLSKMGNSRQIPLPDSIIIWCLGPVVGYRIAPVLGSILNRRNVAESFRDDPDTISQVCFVKDLHVLK